jgi:aspartyl-tRNA(Asn)/glutamyl-tRNA(Gln) amidotransferase subunit A
MDKIVKAKITELIDALRRQEVTAKEVVQEHLARIREKDVMLKAYLYVDYDGAVRAASEIDEKLKTGRSLPLSGVPVAIKDVISVRELPLTCGSRILRNYVPPYDATVVTNLKRAGAIVLGKTNTDEFAMGSSTENSAYGPSVNPWAQDRVPGGSSGGSAVAVSAGMAPFALGTDTGGSVRLPAAFTGLFGLKPSYGAVSRYGLVAFSNSIEQIGVFARSVDDLSIVYGVISGKDPKDGTTLAFGWNDLQASRIDPTTLRIGLVKEMIGEGVDPSVDQALKNVCKKFENEGSTIEEVSIEHLKHCLAAYYIIAMSEASSNLARFDGIRYGEHPRFEEDWNTEYSKIRGLFGTEVKRRILLGAYSLSSGYFDMYYDKAARFRTLIRGEFEQAFRKFDFLLSPTSPTPAFRLGEKVDNPVTMYLSDVDTVPVNLAGIPAISIPSGFSQSDGTRLPVGVQIMAAYGKDDKLLAAASFLEKTGVAKAVVVDPWGIEL